VKVVIPAQSSGPASAASRLSGIAASASTPDSRHRSGFFREFSDCRNWRNLRGGMGCKCRPGRVPADADTLAFFPACDAGAQVIRSDRRLRVRGHGENECPASVLLLRGCRCDRCRKPARECARVPRPRWNFALDDLEIRSGLRHLCPVHLCHRDSPFFIPDSQLEVGCTTRLIGSLPRRSGAGKRRMRFVRRAEKSFAEISEAMHRHSD
jgi:hypothetical protein